MLSGKLVSLRATEPADVDSIYEWENDPENWLVSDTVAPYSRHQILQFINQSNDIYMSHQCRFMIEDDALIQFVKFVSHGSSLKLL